MALYRFLFAPVLLAVAVLTSTPAPRAGQRIDASASSPAAQPARVPPAASHPSRPATRAVASHPATVR